MDLVVRMKPADRHQMAAWVNSVLTGPVWHPVPSVDDPGHVVRQICDFVTHIRANGVGSWLIECSDWEIVEIFLAARCWVFYALGDRGPVYVTFKLPWAVIAGV